MARKTTNIQKSPAKAQPTEARVNSAIATRNRSPPAEDVAELAVDRHHDGGGEQVGGGDPDLVLHAAELADDRRHGGRDDGLVEAGEQHARR